MKQSIQELRISASYVSDHIIPNVYWCLDGKDNQTQHQMKLLILLPLPPFLSQLVPS